MDDAGSLFLPALDNVFADDDDIKVDVEEDIEFKAESEEIDVALLFKASILSRRIVFLIS